MTIQEALEEVTLGRETVFSVVNEIDKDGKPGGKVLTIEHRQVQPEEPRAPKRAESKRRDHVFYDVDGFIAYLMKYGDENTTIFGDPQAGCCKAVLNEKAAQGFEGVVFQPMLHPLFVPWETVIGKRVAIEEFVDFISMHRRSIAKPNGRELTMVLSQVKACTSIEVHRGRGKESLNGMLVKTKIQGQDKESVVEIPEIVTIKVPLYVKTAPREIELDLIVETAKGDDWRTIEVAVSAGDLLTSKVEAFEEMLAKCEVLKTEKKMTLSLGAPRYGAWEYLPELRPSV